MIFNKNDVFYVLLDKSKNMELSEQYHKNLIYNEKYEILMKNNLNDMMEEDNLYSFSIDNKICDNANIKKLFNMIDLLSSRFKFFTNVFYCLEYDETKVLF